MNPDSSILFQPAGKAGNETLFIRRDKSFPPFAGVFPRNQAYMVDAVWFLPEFYAAALVEKANPFPFFFSGSLNFWTEDLESLAMSFYTTCSRLLARSPLEGVGSFFSSSPPTFSPREWPLLGPLFPRKD